jgi:hypothetical protein
MAQQSQLRCVGRRENGIGDVIESQTKPTDGSFEMECQTKSKQKIALVRCGSVSGCVLSSTERLFLMVVDVVHLSHQIR